MRLILIGCGKNKTTAPSSAKNGHRFRIRDMYVGPLFTKRVQYAEERKLPWAVLSAKYGLIWPNEERKLYDETLNEMTPAEVAFWVSQVSSRVVNLLGEPFDSGQSDRMLNPNELVVEIHAGRRYSHPLADVLRAYGIDVQLPCEGLGIGEQLQAYTSGRLAWRQVA